MHPGGANFAFMRRLGPVHQGDDLLLGEQPEQYGRLRAPAFRHGAHRTTSSAGDIPIWGVTQTGGQVFGVYQQLSTRNGGETVSSDQY